MVRSRRIRREVGILKVAFGSYRMRNACLETCIGTRWRSPQKLARPRRVMARHASGKLAEDVTIQNTYTSADRLETRLVLRTGSGSL